MTRLVPIVAGLVAFVAAPVAAADLSDYKDVCKAHSGPLTDDVIIGVMLTKTGTPWSREVSEAYALSVSSSRIGVRLADIADDDVRFALLSYAADIIDAEQRPRVDGIRVNVRGRQSGVAGEGTRLARAYLLGDLDVLGVICPEVGVDGDHAPVPDRPTLRPLVVAGDTGSLVSPLAKRTFATLGYTDNAITDAEFIDVNVVVGLGPTGDTNWIPHVSYQRRTNPAGPLNDLTFGVTGFWRGERDEVRWTGSFETDDKLESSMFRAEVEWQLPRFRFCDDQFRDRPPRYMTCTLSARADYADIADPGEKAKLLTLGEYLRVGGAADLAYGWAMNNGMWLEFSVGLDLMEALDGDDGDARIARLELKVLPSQSSNFTLGLTYEDGQDITSLDSTQMLKATLGFRY
tara:strand:+ start:757 stop:1968 length:1212 start_codon:yes stop_codon:yes gene_type:complete